MRVRRSPRLQKLGSSGLSVLRSVALRSVPLHTGTCSAIPLAPEGPRTLAQGEARHERNPGIIAALCSSPRRGRRKLRAAEDARYILHQQRILFHEVATMPPLAGFGLIWRAFRHPLRGLEADVFQNPGFRFAPPWAKVRSPSGANTTMKVDLLKRQAYLPESLYCNGAAT